MVLFDALVGLAGFPESPEDPKSKQGDREGDGPNDPGLIGFVGAPE